MNNQKSALALVAVLVLAWVLIPRPGDSAAADGATA